MKYKRLVCLVLSALLTAFLFTGCSGDADTSSEQPSSAASMPLPSGLDDTSETSTQDASSEEPADSSYNDGLPPSEDPLYSNYTAYTENSANAPDINNIILTTKESFYSTSTKEITINIANRTGWEIVYAEAFTVEKYSGGDWVGLPFRDDAAPFEYSYPLDNNRDASLTVDLGRLKNPLEVGLYRIGINMICNGYAGEFYRTVEVTLK